MTHNNGVHAHSGHVVNTVTQCLPSIDIISHHATRTLARMHRLAPQLITDESDVGLDVWIVLTD